VASTSGHYSITRGTVQARTMGQMKRPTIKTLAIGTDRQGFKHLPTGLKTKLGSQGDAEVVVSSVVEKDVVAGFGANADRPGKGFKSSSRINRQVRCTAIQGNAAGETIRSILAADAEIIESNFTGNEKA
jgi:hypothetical protein